MGEEETYCWKCFFKIANKACMLEGFRSSCPHCNADLHVCKNCSYWAPGKPNECLVPGTEPIRDREARNFCEEFRLRVSSSKPFSKRSQTPSILGDPPPHKSFASLFKEEIES